MSATVGDLLKISRSMMNSMRERDVAAEASRRSARNILSRVESALDPGEGGAKIPQKKLDDILTEPFPEVCSKNPEIRRLCDDNREMYLMTAEQHLSLEMIMKKYREKIMESTSSRNDYLITQHCLDKHDGMLGVILHEKGVVLGVMEDPIWEDDDGDVAVMQHAAQIVRENEVLRELVKSSYRSSGTIYLSPWSDEKDPQTDPVSEEDFLTCECVASPVAQSPEPREIGTSSATPEPPYLDISSSAVETETHIRTAETTTEAEPEGQTHPDEAVPPTSAEEARNRENNTSVEGTDESLAAGSGQCFVRDADKAEVES